MVNWNLAGTGWQGQQWALESTFEIQKIFFLVGLIKNDLNLPKNSPILYSDCFWSTFEITLLHLEVAVLTILGLL